MHQNELSLTIDQCAKIYSTQNSEELNKSRRLRDKFVSDYPPKRIQKLTLDQYIAGKGNHNSFCYRIEHELKCLGLISGAPISKFGVYYSKRRNAYEFTSRYGESIEDAFEELKKEIHRLITAAKENDFKVIDQCAISPMFKGKLLHIYSPETFVPIYSKRHLEHFISAMNLPGKFEMEWEMQRALMAYRKKSPELRRYSPVLYMRLLYYMFGKTIVGKFSEQPDKGSAPLLNIAVRGARYIAEIPFLGTPMSTARRSSKVDFEKLQRERKRIGDRGEAIVVEMEKLRLINAGKERLARCVSHVSRQDDSCGYDVISFDEDGEKRLIEVKATTRENLDRGFFISSNELEQAKKAPNYYIYFVFCTMTKNPSILPIRNPCFEGNPFNLRPVSYHSTLSSR